MREPLYKRFAETKPLGVLPLSNWGGLEIVHMSGWKDTCVACFNFGNGRTHFHRHTIHYAPSGRAYIRKLGTRYYFDQIMRLGNE